MNGNINKRIISIISAVGFVAAVVTLIQAFSFTHLNKIRAFYFPVDDGNNSIFEFINEAHANVGHVILLDLQINAIPSRHRPFERNTDGRSVTWNFDPCTLAEEVHRRCAFTLNEPNAEEYWKETTKKLQRRFSNGRLTYKDIDQYLVDNGTSITLEGVGQTTNALTSVELYTEGSDTASGPFQISMTNRDGNRRILLSPAPYSPQLTAEVRCAKRKWSFFLKFLVCPFF